MTQSRQLSIIGVSLIALQPGLSAHAQTYPSVVQAEIREAADSCKPEKIELPKDFVTRKDVNADGVPDFIVDWTNVRCKDGTGRAHPADRWDVRSPCMRRSRMKLYE